MKTNDSMVKHLSKTIYATVGTVLAMGMMVTPAMADDNADNVNKGCNGIDPAKSICITNATKGHVYTAYRLGEIMTNDLDSTDDMKPYLKADTGRGPLDYARSAQEIMTQSLPKSITDSKEYHSTSAGDPLGYAVSRKWIDSSPKATENMDPELKGMLYGTEYRIRKSLRTSGNAPSVTAYADGSKVSITGLDEGTVYIVLDGLANGERGGMPMLMATYGLNDVKGLSGKDDESPESNGIGIPNMIGASTVEEPVKLTFKAVKSDDSIVDKGTSFSITGGLVGKGEKTAESDENGTVMFEVPYTNSAYSIYPTEDKDTSVSLSMVKYTGDANIATRSDFYELNDTTKCIPSKSSKTDDTVNCVTDDPNAKGSGMMTTGSTNVTWNVDIADTSNEQTTGNSNAGKIVSNADADSNKVSDGTIIDDIVKQWPMMLFILFLIIVVAIAVYKWRHHDDNAGKR